MRVKGLTYGTSLPTRLYAFCGTSTQGESPTESVIVVAKNGKARPLVS